MITIDDKIASFKKIIHDDIENKFGVDIEKTENETKDIIEKYKEQQDKEIEKIKKEYLKKLEQKKDKIVSKVQKEGQDILLSTNKGIYEEFFKSLNEKIKSKYEGELGEKYLKHILEKSNISVGKDDIVYLFVKTFDRDKKIILSALGDVEVQISNNIKIGGFEVENRNRTYRNNYSLDLVVEQGHKYILTQLKKELGMIS